jgi:hypothetical protein
MKTVHLGRLQRAAASRKVGYLEAHLKVGKQVTIFGQPFVQLGDADYAAIKKEFALARKASTVPTTPRSTAALKPSAGVPLTQKRGSVKLPGIGTMARNATAAAGRVITAAASGQPVQASDEEFQRRMRICGACEFLDKASQRCVKCGCFVAAQVIGKARLATESCPIGKWQGS